MKNAFIFHDSFNDAFSDWYPSLAQSLESLGYTVVTPHFPTPAGQSLASWKVAFGNHIQELNSETLMITHGTGGLFALRILEETTHPIKGLYMVAAFAGKIGNEGLDRIQTSFIEKPFQWDLIKKNVGHVRVLNGTNDPFVPVEEGEKVAENLGGEFLLIDEGGHINKAYGYETCEPLLESIKKSLDQFDDQISLELTETGETPDAIPLSKNPMPIPSTSAVEFETKETDQQSEQKNGSGTSQTKQDLPHARTMYEDMSSLVHTHQGKVVSSILTKARTEESAKKAASPTSLKNILYIIGTIISFVVVGGIAVTLMSRYAPPPTVTVVPPPPSLLSADLHEKVLVDPTTPFFILQQNIVRTLGLPLESGALRDIYYTLGDRRASLGEVLKLFPSSHIPSEIFDELSIPSGKFPTFMHGALHTSQGNAHFLIVKVEHYDQSFSLMKKWEPFLVKDLGIFFSISSDFLKTRLVPDVFSDEVIANYTVRVARYHAPAKITLDEGTSPADTSLQNVFANTLSPYKENDVMLGYFFLNEKTLIITDQLDIIPELVKRWANQQIY
jgi:predicted alpha/beta hydrolase family esterase